MESNLPRQLKIKLGTLKRLHKEYISYQKEAEQQVKKIEDLKAQNEDEYTIKKQIEVLQETQNMLPNCQGRLNEALNDTSSFMDEYGKNESLQEQAPEVWDTISTVKEFLASLNKQD